jgi:hypothetical protein
MDLSVYFLSLYRLATEALQDKSEPQHSPYRPNCDTQCRITLHKVVFTILLSAIVLSVIILSVMTLSVVILSVVMLRFVCSVSL